MALLKKIKGSSLIETLVATVLIVVVFILSSLILNNLFKSTVLNNTQRITTHIHELQYLYQHGALKLPYHSKLDSWSISVEKSGSFTKNEVVFRAINLNAKKELEKISTLEDRN